MSSRDPNHSAELLQGVLDSSLDGTMVFEAIRCEQGHIEDFQCVLANPAAARIAQQPLEQLQTGRMLDLFPGIETDGLFSHYVNVAETGCVMEIEHHYQHEGLDVWLVIKAVPLSNGVSITFSDITKQKIAEAQFRMLFDRSSDAHLLLDENGIIDCNQATLNMLGGLSKAHICRMDPVRLSPVSQPDGQRSEEKHKSMVAKANQKGHCRYDWQLRKLDGTDFPVEVTLTTVDLFGSKALMVVWHDMTERISAAKALAHTAERLAEAQALAKIGSWEWHPNTGEIHWSDETRRIFGLGLDAPIPSIHEHTQLIHVDDHDAWTQAIQTALRDHLPYRVHFRTPDAHGGFRMIESRGKCQLNEQGLVERLFGTMQDITEEHERKQALRVSQERFDLITAGSHEGIWDWDCHSNTVYWSDRFKEILGDGPSDALFTYEEFMQRLHPEDHKPTLRALNLHLTKREPFNLQYRLKHRQGHFVWLHAAGQAQWDENGNPVRMAGSVADITEAKDTEETLTKLSLVASLTDNSVIITDAAGCIEWVNAAFPLLTGYTLDEVKGVKPGPLLQGPKTCMNTARRITEKLAEGMGFRETILNYAKGGRPYWVDLEVQPILNDKGQVTNFIGIQRDVTEARESAEKLATSEARLTFALDAANAGLWDWDLSNLTMTYSDRWYSLLGYKPGSMPMTHGTWMQLVHPDDLEATRKAFQQHIDGLTEQCRFEARMKNSQGQWQWVLTAGKTLEHDHQGRSSRVIGVLLDIDRLKSVQEQLSVARDQAESASQAKSAFVANMSHEIRTPLTAILGYADLITNPDASLDDAHQHGQTIRRNGEHLLAIVNDILDVSKIEAGKMQIESVPFNLHELFNDVIQLMGAKAQDKGLDLKLYLSTELPNWVRADPTRLKQIVLNLVSNAIKFTQEGSIQVSVGMRQRSDGSHQLTTRVTDTGIGLNAAQRGRLFEAFTQADSSTTRNFGGTGLGLTISRSLARMMGGDLTCHSVPGEGSTFTTSMQIIPMAQAPEATASTHGHQQAKKPQPLLGMHILLVEDGIDNQRLIKHYLTKAGAEVSTAMNGKEACLLMLDCEEPPELNAILMDMQMPILDGYSATRMLRQADVTLPIFALTAHASESDRAKCLAAGCDDYLTKPIEKDKLIRTLAELNHPTQQAA